MPPEDPLTSASKAASVATPNSPPQVFTTIGREAPPAPRAAHSHSTEASQRGRAAAGILARCWVAGGLADAAGGGRAGAPGRGGPKCRNSGTGAQGFCRFAGFCGMPPSASALGFSRGPQGPIEGGGGARGPSPLVSCRRTGRRQSILAPRFPLPLFSNSAAFPACPSTPRRRGNRADVGAAFPAGVARVPRLAADRSSLSTMAADMMAGS